MQALEAEFFSFLEASLAGDPDVESRLEDLCDTTSIGVFSRNSLVRLGAVPPIVMPEFVESKYFPSRPPLLSFFALEAVVKDDMPLLFFLLGKGIVTMDLKLNVSEMRSEFPYMLAGDSLTRYLDRFPCFWCRKLLAFWNLRANMTEGGSRSGLLNRRGSRGPHSRVAAPLRRGSYAIMKRDLEKTKDDDALLIIIRFDDGRIVNLRTSSAKKSRHLVYELGEEHNLDLEAWALKRADGCFLDDYKSLKQNNVRSGDELVVALKYSALQHKTFSLLLHRVQSDGTYVALEVDVDPYAKIGDLMSRIVDLKLVSGDSELFLPLIVEDSLRGLWMSRERSFAGYGVQDWVWTFHAVSMRKPLLIGTRSAVSKYVVIGTREVDARISVWWTVLNRFSEALSYSKKADLERALTLGIPAALRVDVWDRALGLSELIDANPGLFSTLADMELCDDEEEVVLEKIERDLDRTMPYHPYFRLRFARGQSEMFKVLRAVSLYDKEVRYCQGLNFVCATLLTVMDPERAFWAIVVFLGRFGLRANYANGMVGLHSMLSAFDEQVARNLPELYAFMLDNGLIAASFATEWFLTLFSASTASGESTLHIWDVFVFKGIDVLPVIGLAILRLKGSKMMENPEKAVEVLKNAFREEGQTSALTKEIFTIVFTEGQKRKEVKRSFT